MADFTIVERTEPFTLDEVFSFIDDTNISKMDAHELKSRIVDMVQAERNKVIDEFAERIVKRLKEEVSLLENERNEAREYEDEQIIFATNNQLRAFEYSLRVIAEELNAEQLKGGVK